MLAIRQFADKGRGIYAKKRIRAGQVIERCPVIPLSPAEGERIEPTILDTYCFCWGDDDSSEVAIVLGYGSIYNHSYQPNADFQPVEDERRMDFVALRDIAPGEEITINYNGSPEDQSPIWFGQGGWGWYPKQMTSAPKAA